MQCDFCGLKVTTRVKFTRACVACLGKTVWTVGTSTGGAHSSRNLLVRIIEKRALVRRNYLKLDRPFFHVTLNSTCHAELDL